MENELAELSATFKYKEVIKRSMEAIRIIKVHIPLEGVDTEKIVEGFREIARRYGREVKIEEIKRMIEERFGAE